MSVKVTLCLVAVLAALAVIDCRTRPSVKFALGPIPSVSMKRSEVPNNPNIIQESVAFFYPTQTTISEQPAASSFSRVGTDRRAVQLNNSYMRQESNPIRTTFEPQSAASSSPFGTDHNSISFTPVIKRQLQQQIGFNLGGAAPAYGHAGTSYKPISSQSTVIRQQQVVDRYGAGAAIGGLQRGPSSIDAHQKGGIYNTQGFSFGKSR